jgi:hypothetical protein
MAGWSLAGVADFNDDGHPDYLLFNANTHQTVIWYMTGVTFYQWPVWTVDFGRI